MRRLARAALPVSCIMAASCGGGGGGSSPPPPPPPPPAANNPPAFTSATTATVAENSSGIAYQATATDPDGNALTFSLSGGADRSAFSITPAGALSFVAPPDFETPTDSDRNNTYLVQVQVSDGVTSTTRDVAVAVTNAGPDAFRVTRVGTGFAQPVFVAPVPDGSGRVFVVERAGPIRILNPGTGARTTFLDLTGQTIVDASRGLLGFATAPDFATTGRFYVFMTNSSGDTELRRYSTVAGNRDVANPASANVLMRIAANDGVTKKGGWIGFGPDGNLYLGVGDSGDAPSTTNSAQSQRVPQGKLLRINVAGDGGYTIPAGNPNASTTIGALRELWASGVRDPFRASFDPATGNLWFGDTMESQSNEVNMMRPSDGGANFGWRCFQGAGSGGGFCSNPPAMQTPPIFEYGTMGATFPRTIGGYVYRGVVEALQGQYFFADAVSGDIWSLPVAQARYAQAIDPSFVRSRRADLIPNQGTINAVISFGVDQVGNLYLVDTDGEIFRIEPQ